MQPTVGSNLRSIVYRILGTLIGVLWAFVAWEIGMNEWGITLVSLPFLALASYSMTVSSYFKVPLIG